MWMGPPNPHAWAHAHSAPPPRQRFHNGPPPHWRHHDPAATGVPPHALHPSPFPGGVPARIPGPPLGPMGFVQPPLNPNSFRRYANRGRAFKSWKRKSKRKAMKRKGARRASADEGTSPEPEVEPQARPVDAAPPSGSRASALAKRPAESVPLRAAAPSLPRRVSRSMSIVSATSSAASSKTRLHDEIVDWVIHLEPTPRELANRETIVSRVRAFCVGEYAHAQVHPFGSYATGLCLPHSDMDLVVLGDWDAEVDLMYCKRVLSRLSKKLYRSRDATQVNFIKRARVPIIKFVDKTTRLQVDISAGVVSGLQSTNMVLHFIARYPPMRSLVLVLKFFLGAHKLNDTHSGGIGSFVLQMMVVSFLQTHSHLYQADDYDLGILLLELLKHYRDFDYESFGFSVCGNGAICKKTTMKPKWVGYRLCIRIPGQERLIGDNSFRLEEIVQLFSKAYDLLAPHVPKPENGRQNRAAVSVESSSSSAVATSANAGGTTCSGSSNSSGGGGGGTKGLPLDLSSSPNAAHNSSSAISNSGGSSSAGSSSAGSSSTGGSVSVGSSTSTGSSSSTGTRQSPVVIGGGGASPTIVTARQNGADAVELLSNSSSLSSSHSAASSSSSRSSSSLSSSPSLPSVSSSSPSKTPKIKVEVAVGCRELPMVVAESESPVAVAMAPESFPPSTSVGVVVERSPVLSSKAPEGRELPVLIADRTTAENTEPCEPSIKNSSFVSNAKVAASGSQMRIENQSMPSSIAAESESMASESFPPSTSAGMVVEHSAPHVLSSKARGGRELPVLIADSPTAENTEPCEPSIENSSFVSNAKAAASGNQMRSENHSVPPSIAAGSRESPFVIAESPRAENSPCDPKHILVPSSSSSTSSSDSSKNSGRRRSTMKVLVDLSQSPSTARAPTSVSSEVLQRSRSVDTESDRSTVACSSTSIALSNSVTDSTEDTESDAMADDATIGDTSRSSSPPSIKGLSQSSVPPSLSSSSQRRKRKRPELEALQNSDSETDMEATEAVPDTKFNVLDESACPEDPVAHRSPSKEKFSSSELVRETGSEAVDCILSLILGNCGHDPRAEIRPMIDVVPITKKGIKRARQSNSADGGGGAGDGAPPPKKKQLTVAGWLVRRSSAASSLSGSGRVAAATDGGPRPGDPGSGSGIANGSGPPPKKRKKKRGNDKGDVTGSGGGVVGSDGNIRPPMPIEKANKAIKAKFSLYGIEGVDRTNFFQLCRAFVAQNNALPNGSTPIQIKQWLKRNPTPMIRNNALFFAKTFPGAMDALRDRDLVRPTDNGRFLLRDDIMSLRWWK